MTITILAFALDAYGCDPRPACDPFTRSWPDDTGPALGDMIAPIVDGLGWLTVRERRWTPAVDGGWTLTVVVHGRAVAA